MRISQLAAHRTRLLLVSSPNPRIPLPAGIEPRPEMVCFRGQTLALVRHFFEISSQVGRVSSLLGREFFRSRVSHHAIPSFEEQAVFVRDVELCLSRLSDDQAEVITLVGLYGYSPEEVGEMLHRSRSRIHTWFSEALDHLSEIFLRANLLREDRPDRRQRQNMRTMNDHALTPDVVGSRRKPPQSVRVTQPAAAAMRVCARGSHLD